MCVCVVYVSVLCERVRAIVGVRVRVYVYARVHLCVSYYRVGGRSVCVCVCLCVLLLLYIVCVNTMYAMLVPLHYACKPGDFQR